MFLVFIPSACKFNAQIIHDEQLFSVILAASIYF